MVSPCDIAAGALSATEDGRKAAARLPHSKKRAGWKPAPRGGALENPATSAGKSYVKQMPEDTALTNYPDTISNCPPGIATIRNVIQQTLQSTSSSLSIEQIGVS
jgi:hypothetical protein